MDLALLGSFVALFLQSNSRLFEFLRYLIRIGIIQM